MSEEAPAPATILIVDDNPVNVGLLVEHLEAEGYQVRVALGGFEALERVRFAQPDLILLDVMMPDLDGLEVCRRLRADSATRDIPVVFMTALADVRDKVAAFEAGGVDYISKPFQVEELLARVRTHLALRSAQQRLREHAAALEAEVDARRAAEQALRYMALHDALTGLPNRTMLMDRLQQAIAQARRDQRLVGVLLLDLDRFKQVNDSLGHFAGDELLEQVARRLRSVLRESDTAARLGGDEFVIAAGTLHGPTDAEQLAARVLKVLEAPFLVQGRALHVGATIGISLYPGDGDNPAALLQAADTAMYQAKRRGRGSHRLFSRDLSVAAERWHSLSHDLHGACERGEFVLHYQPQVLLASGVVTGLEALLRWEHPSQGLIAPALFIPLLEEHGLMVEVGRWALRSACAQAAAWQAQGLPPVRVAVNLSAQQFYRGDVVGAVREALETAGLAPEWLELELTESLTLDDGDSTLRIMNELKALGVALSLDDFGTGWSSLGYLRRFPLDRIKIDRAFVRDLLSDSDTAAIVHSILDLARRLGLDCVAEGVETPEQLDHLRRERCPSVQGFLYSQGLPAADVAMLLRAGRAEPRHAHG
ncbi:putative bifunctional diguanylate cyclase/phosphodiesterase [Sphingomonas azotifigens]|uniref:putative bifunctional diguanylate cyclase/phosphodiesterase n=1 Tax=Sphingomonas azotifigens TaxID=330920 RepID=UPI000A035295|nr:GGDEF domain-containing response regulator [Sphingomonas azotifigens]